jgi:lysophospholipase L1-like esterase
VKRLLVGVLGILAACSSSSSDAPASSVTPPPPPPASDDGGPTHDASIDDADAAPTDDGGDAGVDAEVDSGPDAGPPAVRYVGRFDTSDPTGPKIEWPGARIIARFDGTSTVKATFVDNSNGPGNGEFDIVVDGTTSATPLALVQGQSQYTVASGLGAGPHTIELWRRTEALVSTTQFLGFDFQGGTLLPPPLAPARRIEFLGDSGMNGFGIDGPGPNCPFSAPEENEHRAYPALIAQDLGADHHDLAYSGKGVYWNFARTVDTQTFGLIYGRTLPQNGGSSWSFASFVPDVVWITLGGNDYDQPNGGDPPPPIDQFKAKYDEVVGMVRTNHPNAHIFCAVAPSLNDDYPVGYNAYTNIKTTLAQVVSARNGAGDTKIYTFEFTRSNGADLTGCLYHPNRAKHRAMADEAIAFIKSKTGWL